MDVNFLIYKIRNAGETVDKLAEALGIHPMTLRDKMRGRRAQFKQSEIQAIADRYELTADEVSKIFFKPGEKNE